MEKDTQHYSHEHKTHQEDHSQHAMNDMYNHDHKYMDHDHTMSEHNHHNHEHASHHGHHHHHGNFKKLFFQSLPIGLIIMVISPMGEMQLPFQFTFPYSDIVTAILATILLFIGGKPFFQGAEAEFADKAPSMMALVAMGLGVSYFYSLYAVIMHHVAQTHEMNFFFEFASLILIMLLGHWIEMQAVGNAGDAQESLAELLPKNARLVTDSGEVKEVPINELQQGDVIRVQAGENIPADGKITAGETRVNESLLTGESKPVSKKVGDEVIGGSTNGDQQIEVKVQVTGQDSFIAQVQTLVSDAQGQASRAENLANKVASWLFYIALGAAIIAIIIWLFISDLPTAVKYAVSTLVIACPHALGLAIPLVIARSTSIGARHGILIKDREAYELADKADDIILDKTGTLTTGEFKVLDIQSLSDTYDEKEVISLLAGLESGSSHPIAQSIMQHAKEEGVTPENFADIEILSGKGIKGRLNDKNYQLISQKAYCKEIDTQLPKGATVSILTENDQAIGLVALGDELKPSAKELIQALKDKGLEPIMATGDNEASAKVVADELDIAYHANQSPNDKYDLVEKLKNENKQVIMVGDGVNDAPSLALADVGIAIGAGTQVALDSADVILTKSDPNDIQALLQLAHATNRKMKQNLAWGAGYNFIAIPLAAGLLASIGITINPAFGAILMSLSTVIVAINAVTLHINADD